MKLPRVITPGWDYVCITDQEYITEPGPWQIERISRGAVSIMGQKLTSRYFKIGFPPEADVSIYIDATYKIAGDLNEFVAGMDDGIHMTPHPQRSSVYKELEVVKSKQLDNLDKIDKIIERYKEEGFEDNHGLYRCGVIVRVGNQRGFNQIWWEEIKKSSWRDQPSAPYTAWKTGQPIHPIEHGRVEKYFKPHLHSPRKLREDVVVNPPDISKVSKESWIAVGDITYDEAVATVREYPLTHCIQKPKALIFQRWLFDYLPDTSKMLEHVKIYSGSYAFYF